MISRTMEQCEECGTIYERGAHRCRKHEHTPATRQQAIDPERVRLQQELAVLQRETAQVKAQVQIEQFTGDLRSAVDLLRDQVTDLKIERGILEEPELSI